MVSRAHPKSPFGIYVPAIPAKNGTWGASSDGEKLFHNEMLLQDNWWVLPGRVSFFFIPSTKLKQKKCVIFIVGERCWICTHKGSTGWWNELGRADFPIWSSSAASWISSLPHHRDKNLNYLCFVKDFTLALAPKLSASDCKSQYLT